MKKTLLFVFLALAASVVLAACMQKDLLAPVTETPIEKTGGVAFSPDGKLSLTFSDGTLSDSVVIRIEEHRDFSSWSRVSPSYRVTASNGSLREPINVALQVDTANFDVANETVFLADVAYNPPVAFTTSSFDPATKTLTALIDRYPTFGAVRRSSACVSATCGEACGSGLCDLDGRCLQQAAVLCNTDPDAGVYPNESGCHEDGGIPFNNVYIKPCGIDEIEPNDTPASAQAAVHGLDQATDIAGEFDGNDDVYLFTIPAGQWGSLFAATFEESDNYSTCASGLEMGIEVTDEFGRTLITFAPSINCPSLNYFENQNIDGLWPGNFYIRVFGPPPSGGAKPYHIAIYLLSPQAAPSLPDGGISPRDSGY